MQSGNRQVVVVGLILKGLKEMGVKAKMNTAKDTNLKLLLGQRIKFFRKKKALSQEQLAEMVNMETKSLSRIESGHNYPMYENLVSISYALDVEPWQLYYADDKKDVEAMREEIFTVLQNDTEKIPAVYQYLSILK